MMQLQKFMKLSTQYLTHSKQNKLYLSILVEVEVIASSVLHENKCFK